MMIMKNCNNADLEQAIDISHCNVYKIDAIGVNFKKKKKSGHFRSILTGVGKEALGINVNIDY